MDEWTVLHCEQDRSLPIEWFDTFLALGFINLCTNPLIYAARYEVFRKSLRKLLNKDNSIVASVAMSDRQ